MSGIQQPETEEQKQQREQEQQREKERQYQALQARSLCLHSVSYEPYSVVRARAVQEFNNSQVVDVETETGSVEEVLKKRLTASVLTRALVTCVRQNKLFFPPYEPIQLSRLSYKALFELAKAVGQRPDPSLEPVDPSAEQKEEYLENFYVKKAKLIYLVLCSKAAAVDLSELQAKAEKTWKTQYVRAEELNVTCAGVNWVDWLALGVRMPDNVRKALNEKRPQDEDLNDEDQEGEPPLTGEEWFRIGKLLGLETYTTFALELF